MISVVMGQQNRSKAQLVLAQESLHRRRIARINYRHFFGIFDSPDQPNVVVAEGFDGCDV
jgi:hypothetical protein